MVRRDRTAAETPIGSWTLAPRTFRMPATGVTKPLVATGNAALVWAFQISAVSVHVHALWSSSSSAGSVSNQAPRLLNSETWSQIYDIHAVD